VFYDNFEKLCTKIEKNPSTVAEELGFTKSMASHWKGGMIPRVSSRKKIADYFGISVEELMGTKKEPAGQGELDDDMKEFIELAQMMTPEERSAIMTLMKSKEKNSVND
jgi:transcriptional regulator with XRE-family HTH domain